MEQEISKKDYQEIIDEIISCTHSLEKQIGEYPTNAIIRLIDAQIKLANSTIKRVKVAEKRG